MGTPTSISPIMQSVCVEIIDSKLPGLLNLRAEFANDKTPDFKYTPLDIESLHIIQDFEENYADAIVMRLRIKTQEYIELVRHFEGLKCTVTIAGSNRDQTEETPLLSFERLVLITDMDDPSEVQDRGDLYGDDGNPAQHDQFTDVQLELIDQDTYDLRKRQTYFIARQVTIEEILLLFASMCGFDKVHIVPPDNPKTYENFIVPPLLGLNQFLTYVQEHPAYGIYDNGVSVYMTNGVMYIYPKHTVGNVTQNTTHVYYPGKGQFAGSDIYHTYKDGDIQLLCNSTSTNIKIAQEYQENHPTEYIVQPINRLLDNWREVQSEKYEITDNIDLVQMGAIPGMSTNIYTPAYANTDNQYALHARLTPNLREIVTHVWNMAIPFTFVPGGLVKYTYEDKDGVKCRDALCRKAIYEINPVDSYKRLHACVCNFELLTSIID